MNRMLVRRPLGVVVLALGLLAAAGCTADGDAPAGSTQSPTRSPSSASPTPQEVELAIGEPASFTLSAGSGERSRVRLAVVDVTEGRNRDLSDFRLRGELRRATPYYATVRVANTGSGNLSGKRLTLWALDSEGTVRPPAEVIGDFANCRSRPLPSRFTRGESARTCLLFLLPRGTTLEAVQYRFNDRPPYSWPVS